MKSAAELYDAFQRAGFLKPAVWTAQPGGVPQPGAVRHFAPSTVVLDGGVVVDDPSVKFPSTQFAGIQPGDRLDLELQEHVATPYRVRQVLAVGVTGGELLATLAAWA